MVLLRFFQIQMDFRHNRTASDDKFNLKLHRVFSVFDSEAKKISKNETTKDDDVFHQILSKSRRENSRLDVFKWCIDKHESTLTVIDRLLQLGRGRESMTQRLSVDQINWDIFIDKSDKRRSHEQ